MQRQGQKAAIAESDIVITTAQVFGRKAPVLVTTDMVEAMQPGSVIVDMAAETGGNVVGSVAGQEVVVNGVTIIGQGNWPNFVCRDASQMYSSQPLEHGERILGQGKTSHLPSTWRTRSSRAA